MKSYNKVELVGRIGADGVQEKKNEAGKPYWVFDVATGGDKEAGKDADWFPCTCWNEAIASLNLTKGSLVKVVGTMRITKKADERYKLAVKPVDRLPAIPNKTYLNVRVENIQPVIQEPLQRTDFGVPVMSGSLG